MNLNDIILNYIDNFDFDNYIESIEVELIEKKYKSFANEFWQAPNANLTKLKSKHDIPNSISFSDILRQHPSSKYIKLIKDCWVHDLNINNLVRKYGIPFQKITQLVFPIPYHAENYVCPTCLDNSKFFIDNDIKNSNYTITCSNCNSYINNLISIEEAQQRKKLLDKKANEFQAFIDNIGTNLSEIKCPKCQSELILDYNSETLEYLIECSKCNSSYDNYDDLVTDYESWKQRAAMMIKIRAREDEIIEELLANKKPDDIKIKMEEILKEEDSISTINYFVNMEKSLDNNELFIELFKKVKSSSRLAKTLLISICELISEDNDHLSSWTYSRSGEVATKTRCIKPEEPIVTLLQIATKILPIRKVLRELINRNLIYCDEEKNDLHVHPSLIDNLSSIKSLLRPQNISNELSWLIFNKQKFTCYHCGENGRPLKIAYLNCNKDNNNLSDMIGICDLCYYDITENDILIDAMISGTEEYDNESFISWKFLTTYYPDFKNNDEAYGINFNLLNKYSEIDIIKAYAATIEKFSKENNKGNFFAYAEAILRNSEDGVDISKRIMDRYKVDEWLIELD